MSKSSASSAARTASWANRIARAFRDGRGGPLWLMGLIAGALAGLGASGLRAGIGAIERFAFGVDETELATAARAMEDWRLFLTLVITGLIVSALLWIGKLLKIAPEQRAQGVADLIQARAVGGGRVPLGQALHSALVAMVSLGGGASAGREGPAVHLGGALAAALGGVFRVDDKTSRILLACGAASAVAASFHAPVAGALFAFEVVLGHYALRSIAPVAVASVTGALIATAIFGDETVFAMPQIAPSSLWDYALSAGLGVAAAGLAVIFVRAALFLPAFCEREARQVHYPLWALPAIGGVLVGALALIAPEIIGVGYEATSTALDGGYGFNFLVLLIVMKVIATVITLGLRFGGGVFSPSLYLGAMLGAAFGAAATALLGENTAGVEFFAIIGMGALAGAVLGAPLSTTLIVFELTSSYDAAVAVLVAVSMATVLAQSVLKGNFFQKQIQRRGYDLSAGSARLIQQTMRVRDFMRPVEPGRVDEEAQSAFLHEDNTLGRALSLLQDKDLDGAPVRERAGDQKIIGWVSKADAQAAYAKALMEAHEEEHR